MAVDLVCWDFGDTLVDERFMRIAPDSVPEWAEVYDDVLSKRPDWVHDWMIGRVAMVDLIEPLAERLPMTPIEVSERLVSNWRRITWFDDSRAWIHRLHEQVPQAVVTVNPYEFHGIAVACGLDELIPTWVTSADVASESKVVMAELVRQMFGLPAGLTTTVLIDNKEANIAAFVEAGGIGVHYRRGERSLDSLGDLLA